MSETRDDHAEAAIDVSGLGMFFPTRQATINEEFDRLWRSVFGRLGNRVDASSPPVRGRWVFRDLSFTVAHGEVFGIIGSNGCGKTTLLKILSRVLLPSEGSALIRGRVASLLAVGTGFNMAYTGRENVYLNGMVMGLSRAEIRRKFDSIVEFADIGDAIDMPVKHFSSGMRARLAFAVAACLESDVVMLDEVLAVGDASFREKSLEVVRNMKREGRTILLVSHSMSSIESFCDRAMMLGDGRIECVGAPHDVVRTYLDSFKTPEQDLIPLRDRQDREGTGALRIVDYWLESTSGQEIHRAQAGQDLRLCLAYETEGMDEVESVDVGLVFFTEEGQALVRFSTDKVGNSIALAPGTGSFKLRIPRFPFVAGTYTIGFRALVGGSVADYIPNAFQLEIASGDFFGTGVADDHSPVCVEHEWLLSADCRFDPVSSGVREVGGERR